MSVAQGQKELPPRPAELTTDGACFNLSVCPFCGSRRLHMEDVDGVNADGSGVYWVLCLQCKTAGPSGASTREAAAGWNERIADSQSPIAKGGAA